MSNKVHTLLFSLAIGIATSCASNSAITFSSREQGVVDLVPLDNPQSAGQKLGKFPVTLDADKLRGKAVRLAADGKAPQYWFTSFDSATKLDVRVKFLPPPSEEQKEGNRNRPFRLLMKAYQALSSNDFKLARELSGKLSDIEPILAAPHIISGIAFLQEGKKAEARNAFNKAKVLDPEDSEINELLSRVK